MANNYRLTIAALLLVMFVGCGGNRAGEVTPVAVQQQPPNGQFDLPSPGGGVVITEPVDQQVKPESQSWLLPFPEYDSGNGFSLVHTASALQETVTGDSFLVGLAQGDNNGAGSLPDSYVVAPGENNDLAYVVYGITGLTTDRPVGLAVEIQGGVEVPESDDPLPLHYMVGIANYTNYKWEWRGPFSEPQNLVLNSETIRERYTDAGGTGEMYFAVVAMADDEFMTEGNPKGLVGVQVNSSIVNTEPVTGISNYWPTLAHFTPIKTIALGNGKGTSSLSEGQYVTLTWEHVFDIDDPDSEAVDVRVYRQGFLDLSRIPIGKVDSVDNIFVDPLDNSVSADDPSPGDTYQYSLRSFTSAGWSPFTPMEPVSIPFYPPTNVVATDAVHNDKIVLTWTKAEGAMSYEVYRHGQEAENLIATVADVSTYDDLDIVVLDGGDHIYWLRSVNMHGKSSFSDPSTGSVFRVAPIADMQTTPSPPTGNFPLTVDFDASNSYDPDNGSEAGEGIVKYEFDLGEGAGWQDNGIDPMIQHEYTIAGDYVSSLRVTDDDGVSNTANANVNVIAVPSASLSADPLFGDAPLTVNFDASGSTDSDGSIVKYEFDFDEGAGWVDNGTEATIEYECIFGGEHTPTVRVTDDDGAIDTASVTITIQGWASPKTIDSDGNVGEYTSLCVVDGNPAISYFDRTNGSLKYLRATDAEGSTWETPQTLDLAFEIYTSLCVVDGYPAISYCDEGLKYIRATNAAGSSWETPQTLDSSFAAGWYSSIGIVDGYPAISYYANYRVRYIRATNVAGSSWGTPQILDSGTNSGTHTSLFVVDGKPAVSYCDTTNYDLKYVRATNADGTSWEAPQVLDSADHVGQYASLTVVDGKPAISYWDYTNWNLKFVRATIADGSNWGTPQIIDSDGDGGAHTSLTVVNGKPAITYWDYTNDDLKYIQATNADGSSWGIPFSVDTIGNVGYHTSLAVVDGNPAISYYDNTNHDLKYVRWY